MKVTQHRLVVAVILGFSGTATAQQDTFNYRSTSGRDYGPSDWDEVSCNSLDTCPGWPDKLEGSVGWSLNNNQCEHCPAGGNSCGQHRQSPIDLHRDRALADSAMWKECPDWHWMQFKDGSCEWEDMKDSFEISRHALQIHTPLRGNGDVDCVNGDGERKFPKLDYSKGFPDWWYLSRTDIKVPSEHVQQGKRYAAEIDLSHFYEIDHYKNKLGKVSIFMQDFEGEPAWHYLDKLICKWRKVEEEKRAACGLDPAPVYKMCELFRGQERTAADYDYPTASDSNTYPTYAPLPAPKEIPIENYGGDPEEFRLPLGLCQGDCDFTTDCANGLICHRRDPFENVPGCIGGSQDDTNTDYCVFDPYGEGYTVPTPAPTNAPTITARPSVSPLPRRPLADFGGDPPFDVFPLQLCQGDCDNDDHCAEGLMCFQRNENMAVPGCIGGDTDIQKTDYCILDPYGPGYAIGDTDQPTPAPVAATEQPVAGTEQPVTSSPTKNPTSAPVTDPTSAPVTAIPTGLPTRLFVPSPHPTIVPRPDGNSPPKQVVNIGWEPPTPLGECRGDCDEDSDCGSGMYCFQRNSLNAPVPGCAGGDQDPTLTDYCTFGELTSKPAEPAASSPTDAPVTKSPTSAPTDAPVTKSPTSRPTDAPVNTPTTEAPTSSPVDTPGSTTDSPVDSPGDSLPINNIGWSPGVILGRCEGDCDTDNDCGPRLICFQRDSGLEAIPGCLGGETDDTLTDYCVRDPNAPPSPITPRPTAAEEPSPQPSSKSPTMSVDPKPLINRGWSPPPQFRPLATCEGDCDVDNDCKVGLKCFQRYLPNIAVPGCIGGEIDDTLTDFCIVDESFVSPPPTESPVTPVTLAPTESQATTVPTGEPLPAQTAPPNPAPTSKPTADPTSKPTDKPTSKPTSSPTAGPTSKPTDVPTSKPTETGVPPSIECDDFDANYHRMCKDESCCESTRSASTFCHESYDILGDSVESACHHCCLEEEGVAKAVGPGPVVNPDIEKTVACHEPENTERMCKEDSCCDESGRDSDWCEEQYGLWPNGVNSICWYCCFPSKIVDYDTRRALGETNMADELLVLDTSESVNATGLPPKETVKTGPSELTERVKSSMTKQQLKEFYNNQTLEVSEHDRETHDIEGRPIIVRKENFEAKGLDDEDAYFEEIHGAFQRRKLQSPIKENYDDVFWWPYEWLLKVGTEYYFRYEGTQTAPPCYDTAHWRVLKDPIRVAPHQMRELERLIAWRLGNNCRVDTAGRPRDGNPDAVDVNRPVQSYHKLHRKVFCECQDWPSKFPGDREWCRNWKNKDPLKRFYETPYNWPSNGFDFL